MTVDQMSIVKVARCKWKSEVTSGSGGGGEIMRQVVVAAVRRRDVFSEWLRLDAVGRVRQQIQIISLL